MYLAVKMWEYMPSKPAAMPDAWPAEVKELGNSRTLPSSEWRLMTHADLCVYKASKQHLYEAYLLTIPAEE